MPKFVCRIKAEKLKPVAEMLSKNYTEIKFKIEKEGWKFNVASVGIVTGHMLTLKSGMFEEYNYEEDIDICINAESFYAYLKGFKDIIGIGTDGNKLRIKQGAKSFDIGMLTAKVDELPEDQVQKLMEESTVKIKLKFSDMKGIVKDCSLIRNEPEIKFEAKDGKLKISNINEVGNGYKNTIEIPKDMEGKAKYTIENIEKGMLEVEGEIEIMFAKDFPMVIRIENDDISMVFLAAPMMGNEGGDT